jgi:hypothetical protein
MRAQWLQSQTSALAAGDGTLQQGATATGRRALGRLMWQGQATDAYALLDDIGAGFRDDSGFVPQSGVRKVEAGYGRGWLGVDPLNEAWLLLRLEQAEQRPGGLRVTRDPWPGVYLLGPYNLEWTIGWHGHALMRPAEDAPLLRQRFWKSELTFSPAEWMPLVQTVARLGRVVDVDARALRRGGDYSVIVTTRPLPRLELEPRWLAAWTDRDGERAYRETATQWLAVWHFDARTTLRAIWQRTSLERRAEPGLQASSSADRVGSLTWAFRYSTASVLYVGASRTRLAGGDRASELFVKLQVDVDDVRAALASPARAGAPDELGGSRSLARRRAF